jgi:hypothetical protein
MSITVAYRGRLADLARVEDFEDRLLDLALELGALAQIWRSHADGDPQRGVRGVLLHLAPGQETTSLLLSPEGWLISLTEIEDAERGTLPEPPWCFTKTQFGPIEGHVALVELLTALRREFIPDLEVSDEGSYWETRDLAELTRRRGVVQEAIEGLADGLRRNGLSPEAAEDPALLLRHIERVAARVHRTLRRPAEHPPVALPEQEDVLGAGPDPEATEALWDELFKHNRRQQERFERALEERRSRGEDADEAFENALADLGLDGPEEEPAESGEPWHDDVPEPSGEEAVSGATESPFPVEERKRHPLLERAMDLLKELHTIFRGADSSFETALQTLY